MPHFRVCVFPWLVQVVSRVGGQLPHFQACAFPWLVQVVRPGEGQSLRMRRAAARAQASSSSQPSLSRYLTSIIGNSISSDLNYLATSNGDFATGVK